MAYLLGSLPCMEALLEDVHDLQSVISEYVSHLGPLSCPSWKYPDKLAGDVNIDQLLTQYTEYVTCTDSSQDEDAKQVAHVALYELVIDRMVYLLHASGQFTIPIITNMKIPNTPLPLDISVNGAGRNSVGLVVRQGWNLQKILKSCANQLVTELKNKEQLIFEQEEKECKICHCNSQSPSSAEKTKSNTFCLSPDGSIKTLMSRDEYIKSTQTVETSFLPCEACSVAQESLRQTWKFVMQLCQELNLPSRLCRYMSTYENSEWMTTNEVMKWTDEQNKDLAVIIRYFENTFKPLKASVESLEKKCCELESDKKTLEKRILLERETQETFQKQSKNKLEDAINSHQISMNEINKEKENLESQLKNLREKFNRSQDEMKKVKNINKSNEMEIQELREKLMAEIKVASQVEQLKTQIETLKIQAEDFEAKVLERNKELNQERAKNKSMVKHFESIQLKQQSTLDHVEKLNDENTDLQNQLAELQDALDENQDQIENLEKTQRELQEQIAEDEKKMKFFSVEKKEMENLMEELKTRNSNQAEELNKLKENETLLIQYPDLNGQVLDETLCNGDLIHDMELQIQANIVRIELLEKQNHTLRLSLSMNEKYELNPSHEKNLKPVSLWNVDAIQNRDKDLHVKKSEESKERYTENENLLLSKNAEKNFNTNAIEKTPPKTRNERVSTAASLRNNSCSTATKNNSTLFRSKTANSIHGKKLVAKDRDPISGRMSKESSIRTYISLKQQGKLHNDNSWGIRGKSQVFETELASRTHAPQTETQILTFVCKQCDKMYLQEKELEIHSIYCKQ